MLFSSHWLFYLINVYKSIFNLFGLIPWDPPSFLIIGIWPCLMGLTMYLQQNLNPPPPDPIQQKMIQDDMILEH